MLSDALHGAGRPTELSADSRVSTGGYGILARRVLRIRLHNCHPVAESCRHPCNSCRLWWKLDLSMPNSLVRQLKVDVVTALPKRSRRDSQAPCPVSVSGGLMRPSAAGRDPLERGSSQARMAGNGSCTPTDLNAERQGISTRQATRQADQCRIPGQCPDGRLEPGCTSHYALEPHLARSHGNNTFRNSASDLKANFRPSMPASAVSPGQQEPSGNWSCARGPPGHGTM